MQPDLAACITSQGEKERKRKRLASTASLRAQPQQSKDICKGPISHWCHVRAKDLFYTWFLGRHICIQTPKWLLPKASFIPRLCASWLYFRCLAFHCTKDVYFSFVLRLAFLKFSLGSWQSPPIFPQLSGSNSHSLSWNTDEQTSLLSPSSSPDSTLISFPFTTKSLCHYFSHTQCP